MPYQGNTVGQILRVTAANGLLARYSDGKQVMVEGSKPARALARPRGYLIQFGERKVINGRLYIRARGNLPHWYAQEFLEQYNPPPKVTRVPSPVPKHGVTTRYGKRPNNNTYWQARGYHTGSDYAADYGTPVVAVRAGVAYRSTTRVLGNEVILFADNGKTYRYAHLSSMIANGAKVKAGQKLGEVGATGTGANGPHLHFEARKGHTKNWNTPDIDPQVW